MRTLRTTVRPGSTVVRIGGGAQSQWLRERNELLRDLDEKRAMVQVCEGRQCRLLQPDEVVKALRGSEQA